FTPYTLRSTSDGVRELASGEGHALGGGRIEVGALLADLQTSQQALAIGDLNREARTRIELENERAAIAVEHDVDADIAEPRQLVTACGNVQDRVPCRNLNPGNRIRRIRVMRNDLRPQHAIQRATARKIDAGADRALMQVRLPARYTGG